MTERAQLLRQAINLQMACNRHGDLDSQQGAYGHAYNLVGEIARGCTLDEIRAALDGCDDEDTARESLLGQF